MTTAQQRAFIALDEWLGIVTLIYLWQSARELFWIVLPAWVIAVYVISYPLLWWRQRRNGEP